MHPVLSVRRITLEQTIHCCDVPRIALLSGGCILALMLSLCHLSEASLKVSFVKAEHEYVGEEKKSPLVERKDENV